MLSEEFKKEMLEDGLSKERMLDFRQANNITTPTSLDDYLNFLRGLQKIFGPFPISQKITKTENNKL
ncbi:MAG: hypothetical protein HYY52_06590 [Candidatus Melainabacteria bacterium]|nr:hypothetical protein [Candidatus Melainabacteria bacterium]